MDLEAKAIGLQSLALLRNNTAPSPNDKASADTLVGVLVSYNMRVVGSTILA